MPEITQSLNPAAVRRISDLLHECTFADVEQKIRLHYGARELAKHRSLFDALADVQPELPEQPLLIHINAFFEDEEEDIRAEEFDEDDNELIFDVCLCCAEDATVYSIAGASHAQFLGFGISPATLRDFSAASILAHCLYELSCYGFDDRTDG